MGPCRRQHGTVHRSIPIDAEATDHDDDENKRIPCLTSGYARMRCASCLPSGGPERQLDPFTHELPLLTAIKEHIVRRGPHNCVSVNGPEHCRPGGTPPPHPIMRPPWALPRLFEKSVGTTYPAAGHSWLLAESNRGTRQKTYHDDSRHVARRAVRVRGRARPQAHAECATLRTRSTNAASA